MKELKITKGQYLTDIYPEIETNTILCKTLTGLGATYSEIKAKRDSIIIEPNVPVITGKSKVHKKDNLFGVMEGIDTDNVVDYIARSKNEGKNIKIITTPESFYKVKNAYEELGLSIEKECFILIDESHKLIKDRDYRPNILLAMDVFFKAKNKALVSATPIIPSDPRFREQNFKVVKIMPDFDYAKDIHLLHTNNILQGIKFVINVIKKKRPEERSFCIFVNSIDIITQLLKYLGIENESSVFCSDKSVKKLKDQKFKQAYSSWDVKHKQQYMFFTSRFYNAVDIELDEEPDVVLISEPFMTPYSMMDPATDVVQALGRFRKGISSAVHVYSTNQAYQKTSKAELKGYINALEQTYNGIKTLRLAVTSTCEDKAYSDILEAHPYQRFLVCGDKDYFAIDNYIDDELTKSFYGDRELLVKKYQANSHFKIVEAAKAYRFTDQDRLALSVNSGSKLKLRKQIVRILDNIAEDKDTEMFDEYIRDLKEHDSLIVEAYFELGREVIEQCRYSAPKLKEKLTIKKYEESHSGILFLKTLKESFEIGKKYSLKNIKEELKRIFELFGIDYPYRSITAQTIKDYFEVDEKARIGNDRAMRIIKSKI